MRKTSLLNDDIRRLLADPQTLIALATLGRESSPQVDFITELQATADNRLEYLEFHEGSRTQKHLFHALWFEAGAIIALRGMDGAIFEIEVRPERVHVTGEYFQRRYAEIRASGRAEGLAGVWILAPVRVSDRSPATLAREYCRDEPFNLHLDVFALP